MILNKIIRQFLEIQLSIPPPLEPCPQKLLDRIYKIIPPTDLTNNPDRCVASYSSVTLASLLTFNLTRLKILFR